MSATEILEQISKLPESEQREVMERLEAQFGYSSDGLSPEQITELDRRAEDALKHSGRGKPAEQVFAEIEERYRGRK